MAACTLDVGPRRVLVSEEGAPAAEFALFDPSDIELAPGENGGLRESGYRTTAADAVRRLAVAGVTLDFAHECADIARGRIAEAYARGRLVRRLAPLLGPHELFDGGTYDATLRRYEGTWLDLALLANDAGLASATGVLHAAGLAALLGEVGSDTPVVLTTLGHAESLRLGERTLRRQAVDNVAAVPRALRQLAQSAPAPRDTEGPTREQLSAHVEARLAMCARTEAREHLMVLKRALVERRRPAHGPLSDAELWEADTMLGQGEVAGALRRIDAREARVGREPGTIYLRARAALLQGRESPRVIAQRVGEMALSMNDFPEVELLAAQAWTAAGETRNALPFARDLATNPRVAEDLRTAAEAILRAPRAGIAQPLAETNIELDTGDRAPSSERVPERPGERTPSERGASERPGPAPRPTPVRPERPPGEPGTPAVRLPPLSATSPVASSVPPPQVVVHDSRTDLPLSRTPSERPRPRTLTPPGLPPVSNPTLQMHQAQGRRYLTPPERVASPLPPRSGPGESSEAPEAFSSARAAEAPEASPRRISSVPPAPSTPRSATATPRPPPPSDPPTVPRPSPRIVQPAPWPTTLRAPREERVRPEEIERTPSRGAAQRYMRGASLPPVASEPPAAIPRAPVVPRVDIDEPDLIETLPLPRGAGDTTVDPGAKPRTPLEARVRFTIEARELARRYRHDEGVELRLELRAIASIQRHLLHRFASRAVSTPEDAREAELHGALLSELLVRLLDAEWVDIGPTELGYWAMVVPVRGGAGKRVWPFGRVLRFIASGSNGSGEDDLVAFFRRLREI